jgi:hypothetical protein
MATEQVSSLPPLSAVRRYLRASGWRVQRQLPAKGLDLFVSSAEDMQDIEIVLPERPDLPDAERRVALAVRSIAQFENRDLDAVLASLQAIGFDVVRAKLPDHLVFRRSIKLDVADRFVRRMRRLLAASADAQLQPLPSSSSIDRDAQSYADRCRFGHTFEGSFGFSVESPVGAAPEFAPGESPPPPPFERLVVQRLMRGLRMVNDAARQEAPELISREYKRGLNANACEELIALVEGTTANHIGFEFVLSPEWSTPADLTTSLLLDLRPAALEVVREAAKQMRERPLVVPVRVIGRVIRLETREDPSDLFHAAGSREVTVEWPSEDWGRLSVRVRLGPTEYLQAVEAHREGREISVSGVLERGGRGWFLNEAHDFSVAPDTPGPVLGLDT